MFHRRWACDDAVHKRVTVYYCPYEEQLWFGSSRSRSTAFDPNRPFAKGRNGQTLRVTDAAFDPAQSFITFDYS